MLVIKNKRQDTRVMLPFRAVVDVIAFVHAHIFSFEHDTAITFSGKNAMKLSEITRKLHHLFRQGEENFIFNTEKCTFWVN